MSTTPPNLIILPLSSPSPPLIPDSDLPTNTAALLLPHLSLFSPPVLALLREYYERYGTIAHWAPIKAFGRVIVVWDEVEGAERAKREGDWLRLDVDIESTTDETNLRKEDPSEVGEKKQDGEGGRTELSSEIDGDSTSGERTYFSPRRRKRASQLPKRG